MAYDVLIRGGKVVDGSGNPWFYGDVALTGDKVVAVAPRGRIDPSNAAEVIDATGHIVCPGFIDIQSHSIMPLFADGRLLSKAHQGVTTEIMGEGWTPAPFGGRIKDPMRSSLVAAGVSEEWGAKAREWTRFRAWLEAVEERGSSLNIGSFVGGGTIREYARGWDMGEPTADEVATMCRVMDECMQEGAFGIATALIYPPGSYAGTEELVEIAKVIGRYGGVYITHIRSESDLILDGMAEAIDIGTARRVLDRDLSPEGVWRNELAPDAACDGDDRRGTCLRRRHHCRHVSLRRQRHRYHDSHPGLGT